MTRHRMEIDPRYLSPDDRGLSGPDGYAFYLVSAIPATSERGPAYEWTWDQGSKVMLDGREDELGYTRDELCGIIHGEDVEVWQLPHTARPATRLALKVFQLEMGVRPQLVRVWQHIGPCEQARQMTT